MAALDHRCRVRVSKPSSRSFRLHYFGGHIYFHISVILFVLVVMDTQYVSFPPFFSHPIRTRSISSAPPHHVHSRRYSRA